MPSIDRPLKVFLCHLIPLWDAYADRDPIRALPEVARLITPVLAGGDREDGMETSIFVPHSFLGNKS